jgi:pimeloyl-ACP methyl ester carboxylesterase
VQGSGPALVLLHDWPQTWYQWRLLIPPLAERYCDRADLRGYGLSDSPAAALISAPWAPTCASSSGRSGRADVHRVHQLSKL